MTSMRENNLIVFLRRLLLVDILLLSLNTQLSSTAEIKIRINPEKDGGLEKVIPQLNRQQRRYDDQKGYTQITVDLDSIEEKEYLDEKKNNFEGSRREVQATVFEFEPRQDYIIAERTENNLNGGRHDTDDRHKNRVSGRRRNQNRGKSDPVPSKPPYTVSNHHRGLVPQLWENYTKPSEAPAENVSCNTARFKCAQRPGCKMALTSYAMHCNVLVAEDGDRKGKRPFAARHKSLEDIHDEYRNENVCSSHCRHSLIALMSTHEGRRMMKCDCEDDSFCERSKASVAPCQEEVELATDPDTIVSCTSAQWICAADPDCSTALDWYNTLCRAMFKGRKCTKKCHNSISILRRQKAARKLETCYCDGTEDFKCNLIKSNMEALCFRRPEEDILSNEIEVDRLKGKKSSSSSLKHKLERFLIIVSVFIGLFITYISASINAAITSFQTSEDETISQHTK